MEAGGGRRLIFQQVSDIQPTASARASTSPTSFCPLLRASPSRGNTPFSPSLLLLSFPLPSLCPLPPPLLPVLCAPLSSPHLFWLCFLLPSHLISSPLLSPPL